MRKSNTSETTLHAVRRALAAGNPEEFPAALAATGLDEATLAACLAELAHRREVDLDTTPRLYLGRPAVRLTRRGRRRAVRPALHTRALTAWRAIRPQVIDVAWKIGAAVAAAGVIGALGLG